MEAKQRLAALNALRFHRERGAATLIVVVVLVALLAVTVLTVTRVATLELKTAANTNRAKEAFHVAQGGLDFGAMKYVEDPAAWDPSGTTSVAIPSSSTTQSNISIVVSGGTATVTAVGESVDGTGSATVEETYGTAALAYPGKLPPLMAGGNFPPGGSFSIVTNPNGGGEGVPVSAWVENSTTTGTGSWQSCNLDEFLNEGNNASRAKDPDYEWICDDCTCQQADNHLCEAVSGEDPASCGDVVADPCVPDTFDNLFGTNMVDDCTSDDDEDADGNPVNFSDNLTQWQDVKARAVPLSCGDLDANVGDMFIAGGTYAGLLPLVWVEGDCSISQQVASADAPVIVVVHGDVTMNGGASMFGIMFAFSNIYTAAETYELKVNGSPKFYGSILVNGPVDLPAGSFTLVYSDVLLRKLTNTVDGERFETIARFPGSWTDLK